MTVLDLVGSGKLTVSDPLDSYGLVTPDPERGASFSLAPAGLEAGGGAPGAAAGGAPVRESPATFVSGDRFASILDPFGVRWSIMTRVEDLSFEESARRVAEWAAQQG